MPFFISGRVPNYQMLKDSMPPWFEVLTALGSVGLGQIVQGVLIPAIEPHLEVEVRAFAICS
jgi:hypothetical protein